MMAMRWGSTVSLAKDTQGVSLSPDGKRLAACSSNGLVHLWDLEGQPRELTRPHGHHGSVHLGKVTLYYAIGVYSEVRNGRENGIPVFGESWKNVVATFYHELNEARTDPDVEDVIDGKSQRLLGWVSNQGDEVGDFPVAEANSLTDVFQEVPLASGAGKVPVQFEYSNAVHGPEGPRDTPYPFWKKRR